MAAYYESVEARLRAYIAPNAPQTAAENDAFEQAVEAQAEYESAAGGVPDGVQSFSIGDFSATMAGGSGGAGYTRSTLSQHAWAILYNAGLIRHAMPVARRL